MAVRTGTACRTCGRRFNPQGHGAFPERCSTACEPTCCECATPDRSLPNDECGRCRRLIAP